MSEADTTSRCIFIRQMVAAPVGVKIPERFRRGRKETHTWSVEDWISELLRVPANSHHVAAPLVPVSVFGLGIDELPAYCKALLKNAAAQTETYRRRGKVHIRRQRQNQCVLFSVVTSWPALQMEETEERKKWLALTTATMQAWYGECLKVGIAHSDEAYYHIHWLVDLGGAPIHRLHAGHAAADAQPVKSKKGEAYRNGTRQLINDYYEAVGKPLALLRMSATPRPRVSRSQAQRTRQLQQEDEAAQLRKRNAELEQKAQALAAAQAQHLENEKQFDSDFTQGEEYLNRRLQELDAEADAVKRQRDQVRALKEEYELKKARVEAEATAMWKAIGDAVATTKAWQWEVRDQVALEARVARVRDKVRPGGGRRGVGNQDNDDLLDIPF
jgi:hypothetical protein